MVDVWPSRGVKCFGWGWAQNPQVAQIDIASVLDDSFVASAEARKIGQ